MKEMKEIEKELEHVPTESLSTIMVYKEINEKKFIGYLLFYPDIILEGDSLEEIESYAQKIQEREKDSDIPTAAELKDWQETIETYLTDKTGYICV